MPATRRVVQRRGAFDRRLGHRPGRRAKRPTACRPGCRLHPQPLESVITCGEPA